jgi:hypothetical protein
MVITETPIIIFHYRAHQSWFHLQEIHGQNFRIMSIGEHSETVNTKSGDRQTDRQTDRTKKKKKNDEAKKD